MQFLYHMHACFLCCPCIKISSLINEKRMTGQERQSCTFHAHISFSVYIISYFQTSYLSMIHFCSSMVKATSADLWGFGGKQIQSHQENGSSLVIGPWTWSFMIHVDLNSHSLGKRRANEEVGTSSLPVEACLVIVKEL